MKFGRCLKISTLLTIGIFVGLGLLNIPLSWASSDFNGDNRDDIISFARSAWTGTGVGDVFVALSNGSSFSGTGWKWHENFGETKEIPAIGDFNGDGRDDIVRFVRSTQTDSKRGDVYVSLSYGSGFGYANKWHDWFAIDHQIPDTGDFNGDGKDDIITFTRSEYSGSATGNVYVALSNGSSFGSAQLWHDWFSINEEIPAVGDFNGDGKDDIVTFLRDTQSGSGRGDVYVALSTGNSFGPGIKWHDFFSIGNEIPIVGDFNGDGRDDIATFVRSSVIGWPSDHVFVALSTGSSFSGKGVVWNDWFCRVNSVPFAGDFNGDGKDDAACFYHEGYDGEQRADVMVALSNGSKFLYQQKWHDFFCIDDEVPTTMAAVFPYFIYAKTYEDHSKSCGGYTSNEEDRFPENVWDFLDEMQDTWPYTQYVWAHPHLFLENHLSYVDSVDIAYVSGHGGPSRMDLYNGAKVDFRDANWGSWSSNMRSGDLEYIAFESCEVLSLNGDWRGRWKATPNSAGPFSGLHLALGFHNNHKESPVFELSEEFAENLEDGFSVRWAWLEATDDEDDWVWFHNNIGVAMYIKPHRYETISGYLNRDRWYHDSDYLLNANYWVY